MLTAVHEGARLAGELSEVTDDRRDRVLSRLYPWFDGFELGGSVELHVDVAAERVHIERRRNEWSALGHHRSRRRCVHLGADWSRDSAVIAGTVHLHAAGTAVPVGAMFRTVTLVQLVQTQSGLLLANLLERVLKEWLLLGRCSAGTVRLVGLLQHVQRQTQIAVERNRLADLPIEKYR